MLTEFPVLICAISPSDFKESNGGQMHGGRLDKDTPQGQRDQTQGLERFRTAPWTVTNSKYDSPPSNAFYGLYRPHLLCITSSKSNATKCPQFYVTKYESYDFEKLHGNSGHIFLLNRWTSLAISAGALTSLAWGAPTGRRESSSSDWTRCIGAKGFSADNSGLCRRATVYHAFFHQHDLQRPRRSLLCSGGRGRGRGGVRWGERSCSIREGLLQGLCGRRRRHKVNKNCMQLNSPSPSPRISLLEWFGHSKNHAFTRSP